jgi:uncharacterized protein with PIN domain
MKVEYSVRLTTEEDDYRYRVMVLLVRSGTPKYYKFHCPKCQNTVCELVNADVTALTDVMDLTNLDTIGAGVRCDGSYWNGSKRVNCRTWYYFSIGNMS